MVDVFVGRDCGCEPLVECRLEFVGLVLEVLVHVAERRLHLALDVNAAADEPERHAHLQEDEALPHLLHEGLCRGGDDEVVAEEGVAGDAAGVGGVGVAELPLDAVAVRGAAAVEVVGDAVAVLVGALEARKIASYGDFDGITFCARIGIEKGGLKDKTAGPDSERWPDKNRLFAVTPDDDEYIAVGGPTFKPVGKVAAGVVAKAGAKAATPAGKPAWAS